MESVWNMYRTQLQSLTWKHMEPVWNPYEKKIVWNPTRISDLEVYGTCIEPPSIRKLQILTWNRMEPVWNPYRKKLYGTQ